MVVTEYFSNLIGMFVKKKGVRLIAFVNVGCLCVCLFACSIHVWVLFAVGRAV